MSSEYSVLSTIIIVIFSFLYFSWFISSLRFNHTKNQALKSEKIFQEKSFLKSFVDPDLGSKSVAFFLILINLVLVYMFIF
jgi:hypothetical protein|tara:strand:+ start:793 stop:1035 length:243 start_codon:yes stop_codon:yes gene_type:complete